MLWVGTALVFSVLFFMPGLLEQFETPKIEAVRVCGLGALTLALIAGRAGRPRRWRPLDWAVTGWLAVEILATALSVSPHVSLVGETRQREGLLTSLALAGLYFAAREAFARPGRIRAALHLVLVLASMESLYAILQATGHDPFAWRRQAIYAGTYARPFATLGHPNPLGVLTSAAAALALGLALAPRRGVRPWLAGLYGVAATVLVITTILTLSRAAWLGVGAGLVVAASLALRERDIVRLSPRTLAVAGALVALVVVGLGVGGWGRVLAERFAELLGGGSGSSRIEIWRTALAEWRARPLVGQGPDLFEMTFPRFQTPAYWRLEWSAVPFHAHSIYLHTLATRGVIGLLAALAWALALAAAAIAAWRRRAMWPGLVPAGIGALVAMMVAGAFGALGITGALLVVLTSALLASAAEVEPPAESSAPDRGAKSPTSARPRAKPGAARGVGARPPTGGARARVSGGVRRWVGRLAATAIALIAILYGFTELRASRAASAAQAFMTSAPPRAVEASRYALTLADHDDRLWRMHAMALLWLTTVTPEPTALFAEAETAARHAVALAPARSENHLILARALGSREARGDAAAGAAAEAEFQRTLALAPMDGLSLMEYADHQVLVGRPQAALAPARRVVALYPAEGEALVVLARAQDANGMADSARVTLARAVRAGWRDASARREAEDLLERFGGPGTSPGPAARP